MSSSGDITPELIDAKIAELRGQATVQRERLDQTMAQLSWWEAGRRFIGRNGDSPDTPAPKQAAENGKPTLRAAIRRVMSDRPKFTWPTERVIKELADREWLPGGKYGEHHTRSMLAKMSRSGELKRVKRGHYRLVPSRSEP